MYKIIKKNTTSEIMASDGGGKEGRMQNSSI